MQDSEKLKYTIFYIKNKYFVLCNVIEILNVKIRLTPELKLIPR